MIENNVGESMQANEGGSVTTTPLLSIMDHARFQLVMRMSNVTQVMPYKGTDRAPYHVRLDTDLSIPPIYSDRCVFKPIRTHSKEGKYFRESMDIHVPDCKRELLAYNIDLLCGFGLVPPVVWREVGHYGIGSLQAWVGVPSGGQWRRDFKYDYHMDTGNPWFHRLLAFDILIGNVDRHAGNWLMDKQGRVYAIDNGYAFPKRNDCRFLSSLVLKGLIGKPVAEDTKRIIQGISAEKVKNTVLEVGFRCREESGVLRRLNYLKKLSVWQPVGRIQPQ